jgi:hypothetical protein
MAYSTSTLSLANQPIADRKRWVYTTQDSQATVGATSYISDAAQKGMLAGDFVEVFSSGATVPLAGYLVKTVRTSVTSGSADLSSGMSLSS